MSEIITCEKCGEKMVPTNQTHTAGMTCPNCGWGWVTTDIQPMDRDQTDYSIFLKPGNLDSIDNIKLISSICAINFIDSKKLLQSDTESCIFTATNESYADYSKAGKVRHIAVMLKNADIGFYITPDFPYEINE